MLRRISSSGARRRPSGASSTGRHVVDIVGAERQRDLRELRPVAQPVDLHVGMFGAASRAIATLFTSS